MSQDGPQMQVPQLHVHVRNFSPMFTDSLSYRLGERASNGGQHCCEGKLRAIERANGLCRCWAI